MISGFLLEFYLCFKYSGSFVFYILYFMRYCHDDEYDQRQAEKDEYFIEQINSLHNRKF